MLSSYAEKLSEEAKKRYQDKLKVISSIDPFLLQAGTHSGETSSLPRCRSYLVLQTNFITAKQYKSHKSLEAYNQFVCGWIKEVHAWREAGKFIVTGRVSCSLCMLIKYRT